MQRFRERGLKWVLAPGALVILYVFFGIFGRNYFSYPTFVNIIDAAFYIGFISMGVTFVIISGRDRPFHRDGHDVRGHHRWHGARSTGSRWSRRSC